MGLQQKIRDLFRWPRHRQHGAEILATLDRTRETTPVRLVNSDGYGRYAGNYERRICGTLSIIRALPVAQQRKAIGLFNRILVQRTRRET